MFNIHMQSQNIDAAAAIVNEAAEFAKAQNQKLPLLETSEQVEALTKSRDDAPKAYELYRRFISLQDAGLNPFIPK